MAAKRCLGKGLSALLPGSDDTDEKPIKKPLPRGKLKEETLNPRVQKEPLVGVRGTGPGGETLISLDRLVANPNQPRKTFDEEKLDELAQSIKMQGIIHPIIAEYAGDGTYRIIAGERRTRAARMAGFNEIPVILRKYSTEKQMEISLIENIQRSDLNPIEEAAAYKQLMESGKLSQEDLAVRVGKNRATVANALRLLRLPREMQESIQNGDISPGHARAILSLTGTSAQESLYRDILKKGLSVREAEKLAGRLGEQKKPKKDRKKDRSPELNAIEEKFISRLGTRVVINGGLEKGSIVIDYYSMEDLDRIYDILS